MSVIIIGGGVGGCCSALKIASAGFKVILIEKKPHLLSGTSNHTPGRMGLGFHYPGDLNTAKLYMKATIDFLRNYPNFVLGRDNYKLSHGRYFILKDSLFSKEKIQTNCKKIQEIYAQLVSEDIKNAIVGPPEIFYRVLDDKEYKNIVKFDQVDFAFETQEKLLDWPKFRLSLLKKIFNHKNITVRSNCEVFDVDFKNHGKKFSILTKTASSITSEISAPYVVNATWEGIDEINKTAGFQDGNYHTNRFKLLAEVVLPKSLQNEHSMFFGVGPFCMFSNMGNGLGRITYAPVTNCNFGIHSYTEDKLKNWLNKGLSSYETEKIGQEIINGVSKYIPQMRVAELKQVLPGIVRSKGFVDIYDSASDFHKRDYYGVKIMTRGWVENACMKLFYCDENAEKVLNIIRGWSQ